MELAMDWHDEDSALRCALLQGISSRLLKQGV